MAKTKSVHECTTCGEQLPKWMGQCPGCGHWNTMIEAVIGSDPALPNGGLGTGVRTAGQAGLDRAVPLAEIDQRACSPLATGVDEFDRVLGGGLVPGSISLVGGEPGVGKSTLLTQVSAAWAARHGSVLSVSAEESPQQVSRRFARLGLPGDHVHVGGDCNLESILDDIAHLRPRMAVVDSIQTVFDPSVGSAPGSVAQVRQCAHRLAVTARETDCAIVLVGQVTKDGSLAGPRVLEHLVDSVLAFEGERELGLRVLRALKHRFGPTGELGVFEMTGNGLVTVQDPSGRMMVDRLCEVPGSAVAVTVEGRRPVVLEVQGLAIDGRAPSPRRSTQGFDPKRLSMILAVLDSRVGLKVSGQDVYLSVVGGLKVGEPGADLAVAAAVASSFLDRSLLPDIVVIGEIGLAGELRSAATIERRLTEAHRLGFRGAVVPASDASVDSPIPVKGAATVADALMLLRLGG